MYAVDNDKPTAEELVIQKYPDVLSTKVGCLEGEYCIRMDLQVSVFSMHHGGFQ